MRTKIVIASLLAFGMFAVVVQAQQGRGGFGGMGGVTQLVTQKAVQEELKMTDEQVTKVGDWAKDFRTKAMEIMKDKGVDFGGGFKGGKGGQPNPEMAEKMAAASAEVNKVAFKELGDVLKKEQVERLKQIEIQNMGVSAFVDPEVAEALKLNDSQKTSIKGMVADLNKDRRDIMTEAGLGGGNFKKGGGGAAPDMEKMQEAQKKVQKVQKEYVAKAMDLLNDDQKKTWKTMIGTPFDLSKLSMGGGRGRTKQE
jgi:Spy/CpxP family protein refolding chaperone